MPRNGNEGVGAVFHSANFIDDFKELTESPNPLSRPTAPHILKPFRILGEAYYRLDGLRLDSPIRGGNLLLITWGNNVPQLS